MLAAVLKGPTLKEALEQIEMCKADLYEFRLDLFKSYDLEEIKRLEIPKILKGIAIPHYHKILSFHDFEKTPDLDKLLSKMQQEQAYLYKIATFAKNSLDMMRILFLQKKHGSKLIAISMGELGQPSRILGPIFGTPITYASVDCEPVAPGQLSIQELKKYSVNSNTAIYGLIGDPVTQSVSHLSHNAVFKHFDLNAVYVKFKVTPSELKEFLGMARELNFTGLSVTAPLKELIIPYLDWIDPVAKEIGAVNTLHFKEGKIYGYNTDILGAQVALSRHISLEGKKVHLFGAGGVAKAIAYVCSKEGALVTIQNRTKEKALELCKKYNFSYSEQIVCDLAINCTNHDFSIDTPLAMDIKTRPKNSLFLAGKQAIYGYEMFIEQAIGQFKIWLNLDEQRCREILTKETLNGIDT